MITLLKKNQDQTFDVVSDYTEVVIGDEFLAGNDKDGKAIIQKIQNILEQRKERGTYDDESKRRFWAKIS